MPELTDAQKVNREVTQKRIATALETLAQNSEAPIGLGMTGATVGQVPVVKTVNENGVPTSYEPGAGGGGQEIEVSDTEPTNPSVDVWFQEQQQGTPVEVYTVPEINDMIAPAETSPTQAAHHVGEYIICVINGQAKLYKVIAEISPGETLTVGGNIRLTDGGGTNDVRTSLLNTAKGRADVLYARGSGTPFTSGSLVIPNISKYCLILIMMTNDFPLIASVLSNAVIGGAAAGRYNSNGIMYGSVNYVLDTNTDTISIDSLRRGFSDGTTSNYNGNTIGINTVIGIILK